MKGWQSHDEEPYVDDFQKTKVLEAHRNAFLDSKSEFCTTMSLYKELSRMVNMFSIRWPTKPWNGISICYDSM